MANDQIRHEVRINAPPSAVYNALTDIKQLARWWIPDARGESTIGSNLEFRLGEFCQEMRVTSLHPNQLVRWHPTERGLADWIDTEVEFAIAPHEDRTAVHFLHSRYRDGVEAFAYYSMSWAVRLISLKVLLETGQSHPFPNEWDS